LPKESRRLSHCVANRRLSPGPACGQTHEERRHGGRTPLDVVSRVSGEIQDLVHIEVVVYIERDAELVDPSIEHCHLR
jgi:hypothetical protein